MMIVTRARPAPKQAARPDGFIFWKPGQSRPAEGLNDFSPLEEREGRNHTDAKPDSLEYANREARQLTTPDCMQGNTILPIRVDAGRTSPPIILNDG